MFAKATRNFLREIDSGGDLISVSSLNDSDKLQLLSLVSKKKKQWCWQKPRYQFLAITLNDVLEGKHSLKPVVLDSDFVKYEGTFEDQVSGNVETSLGKVTLRAGGKGHVESKFSFGALKKQEVDLQQLIKHAVGRTINLKNSLLQQVLEGKNEVLCILTKKIVMMQSCLMSEHIQIEEKCGGAMGFKTKIVRVSVNEDGNLMRDSSVVLEIPALTAIAFSVIELYVKQDGQFEFCLLQEKQGGFERKRAGSLLHPNLLTSGEPTFPYAPDAVDSSGCSDAGKLTPTEGPLSAFKQEAAVLERRFHAFEDLPEQHRKALGHILHEALKDEELLAALEKALEDICTGGSLQLGEDQDLQSLQQQEHLVTFLQLVGCAVQPGAQPQLPQEPTPRKKELLTTAYFFISALAEMPDSSPALLETCRELQLVPALCRLPRITAADGSSALQDPTLAPLADLERFGIVQRLFALSNINLERTKSSVKATIVKEPKFRPLILYIVLSGLCALDRHRQNQPQ
ncbi:gasdermin-E [Ornithorhynchus anatinus]|nr:gasdermin-E [Ornithorhynchus anatinus]